MKIIRYAKRVIIYTRDLGHAPLFIDYAEAANKHIDIQNMIKAVNIKRGSRNKCAKSDSN